MYHDKLAFSWCSPWRAQHFKQWQSCWNKQETLIGEALKPPLIYGFTSILFIDLSSCHAMPQLPFSVGLIPWAFSLTLEGSVLVPLLLLLQSQWGLSDVYWLILPSESMLFLGQGITHLRSSLSLERSLFCRTSQLYSFEKNHSILLF